MLPHLKISENSRFTQVRRFITPSKCWEADAILLRVSEAEGPAVQCDPKYEFAGGNPFTQPVSYHPVLEKGQVSSHNTKLILKLRDIGWIMRFSKSFAILCNAICNWNPMIKQLVSYILAFLR